MSTFESGRSTAQWSARRVATQIAKKQSSGNNARNLIAPDLSDETCNSNTPLSAEKKPKKKPKDHLKCNRQALRELQRKKQQNSLEENEKLERDKQKRQTVKLKQFGNVRSRVFDTSASTSSSSSSSTRSFSPSSTNAVAGTSTEGWSESAVQKPPFPSTGEHALGPYQEGTKSARHKSFGKVPGYILERRSQLEEEERQRKKKLAQDAEDYPPAEGMVRMKESERVETLRLLEESEERARAELQRLPLAAQSHGTARKRDSLEIRLREIEDAKRIFSRDKVYIQET